MSYASVARENREPLSQQPHPDTALLNTERTEQVSLPDGDSTKVSIAPADFKEHPKSAAQQANEEIAAAQERVKEAMDATHPTSGNTNGSAKRKERKERAKEVVEGYEKDGRQLWAQAKQKLLQPGVAGGLLGIVNVSLLGTLGYKLYTEPGLRTDQRFVSTSTVAALAVFGLEGWYAEAYRKTEAGKREEAKAREEGAAICKMTREIVLRPGVLGGLVGVVNVGILGGVGYWSWANWDRSSAWDRRTVTATTVGLIALFAGEGYVGEQYREKEYPKHK